MCEVLQFLDYRKYLVANFQQRQERNPAYSLRAFARDLGVTASLVWKILNEKDSVSIKTAHVLAESLRLEGQDKEYFIELVKAHRANDFSAVHKIREIREFRSAKLSVDDAYHLAFEDFAVFIQISLNKKIEATSEWAKALRRDPEVLWSACERLTKGGYIEGSRETGWSTELTHVLADDQRMSANREYHRQYLMHVVEAFHKAPEERFFFTTLRSICQGDYQVFCEKLQESLQDIRVTDTLESKNDMTYLLGVQLIPFEELGRLPVGTVVVAPIGLSKRTTAAE